MTDNYPPGVTGNEWQITGGNAIMIEGVCDNCGFEGDVEAEEYAGDVWWDCPVCGDTNGIENYFRGWGE